MLQCNTQPASIDSTLLHLLIDMPLGKAISTLVALGFVSVAVAEIGAWTFTQTRDDGFPKGLFAVRPGVGYAGSPGYNADVVRINSHHISINSDGYRDDEWNKKRDSDHVLMVGSSALFGVGVERHDRLSERLAVRLNVNVHNAGMYGYGPPQSLSMVRELCSRGGYKAVLYVHEYKLTRNDFVHNAPRTVVDGLLVNTLPSTTAADVKTDSAWITQRVRLMALRQALFRHGYSPRQIYEDWNGLDSFDDEYFLGRYAATADEHDFPQRNVSQAASMIRSMRRASKRCGAHFAMVLLPGPAENRFRRSEPATRNLLTELANDITTIDLRYRLPREQQLFLHGLDYFDPASLDAFARELTIPVAAMLRSAN